MIPLIYDYEPKRLYHANKMNIQKQNVMATKLYNNVHDFEIIIDFLNQRQTFQMRAVSVSAWALH